MVVVLERDHSGREILWECEDCGKPFTKGWGAKCNPCTLAAKRHEEIVKALKSLASAIVTAGSE